MMFGRYPWGMTFKVVGHLKIFLGYARHSPRMSWGPKDIWINATDPTIVPTSQAVKDVRDTKDMGHAGSVQGLS